MEVTQNDDVYVSVTLPTTMEGTVGGGTSLPTQAAGLNILGMAGAGHARALAEIGGPLALAGKISLTAAIFANEFSRAHERLARRRKSGSPQNG